VNKVGAGNFSSTVTQLIPSFPSIITDVSTSVSSSGQIELSFLSPDHRNLTGYDIQVKNSNGNWTTQPCNAKAKTDGFTRNAYLYIGSSNGYNARAIKGTFEGIPTGVEYDVQVDLLA
jgi:hypothetical protein